MKIIFINPSSPIDDSLTIKHPPLGIGYITSNLKNIEGIQVELIDMPILLNPSAILEEKVKINGDNVVYAFTCVTQTYSRALYYAKKIKSYNKNLKVIFGGVHVTFTAKDTLSRHSFIDYIIKFDSEISFALLIQVIRDKVETYENLSKIPNLVFKNENVIQDNEPSSPITNLDLLGYPDRSIFDIDKYVKNDYETVIMTSRGCKNNCSFCSACKIGRTFRSHSVLHVKEEIEECLRLGFKSIFFGDDTFLADRDRIDHLCDIIINENIHFDWTCNLRIVDIDEDILSKMKQAGMYRTFIGFETFNNDTLKSMGKGSTLETQIKATNTLKKLGIEFHSSMIVGCAGQTEKEILSNVKFLRDVIKPTIATFNSIEIRPGTDIYNNPEKYGYYIENPYWYEELDCADFIHVRTKELSEKQIRDITFKCYEMFYE